MDKSWIIVAPNDLQQYVPAGRAYKVTFSDGADTPALFSTVAQQIQARKSTKMYLIVHGITVTSKGSSLGMSMEGDYSLPEKLGGFGLMMGDTPVAIDNDTLFTAWGGCGLTDIVIASCSIVNGDGSGNWGDGRSMCQHIANYAGANVYASDAIQTIGMGWKGNLYQFRPNANDNGRLLARPYPAVTKRVDR